MPAAELRLDQLSHLSHSSISLYGDCSRAWQGRYVDRLPSPPTPALVLGSVFDQAAERFLRSRLDGTPPDLRALWQQEWSTSITEDGRSFRRVNRDTGEITPIAIDWQGDPPERVENEGARLAAAPCVREALEGIEPVVEDRRGPALQRRIELRVPGVPVPVIGYLDYLSAQGPGDLKTAARAWPEGKARQEMQARLYLAALWQEQGPLPALGLVFTHVVFVKGRTPKVQVIRTEFSAAEVLEALVVARAAWRGINAGVFVANPRSWLCGAGCSVWQAGQCMGRK